MFSKCRKKLLSRHCHLNVLRIPSVYQEYFKRKEATMDSVVKDLNDCALIFQILGHFFFSIKNVSFRIRDRWPNYKHTFYFIFLFLFLPSSMILFITTRKSSEHTKPVTAKTFLNVVFFDATFGGWVLELCVILLQSYLSTPLTRRFILNCLKIAETCQNDFQHVMDHKPIRNKLARQTLFLVAYFSGTIFFHFFFSKHYFINHSFESEYLLIICPLIFATTFVLKFNFHVWIINSQLEAICAIVLNFFPKLPFTGIVNVVSVKPLTVKSYRETTSKLQTITRMYFMISKNADLTNQSMGFTLIVVTLAAVFSMIAGTYRILMTAMGRNLGNIVGA